MKIGYKLLKGTQNLCQIQCREHLRSFPAGFNHRMLLHPFLMSPRDSPNSTIRGLNGLSLSKLFQRKNNP